MQFQSFNYILLFFPLTLVLYYLNEKVLYRNIILIIASYIFYAWGNPLWGVLLFLASSVDFLVSKKLGALNLKLEMAENPLQGNILLQKRVLLILSLCFSFGLLAFFKYWNWIIEVLYGIRFNNYVLDLRLFKHTMEIPVGISFYTFETVSYTIDVYRKKLRPTNSFINYLSFISFFPHLVAGPILRAHDLLPQLENLKKKVTSKVAESAFFLISWGLFKKIVFADNLGNLVDRSKENINSPGVGFILVMAFAFQIYCDFSAYSDIARGTAKLFGVQLKRNFLTPYFALNPRDFWQRWHITLSSWVRDYVYIPLGGNRCRGIRNMFNGILTMFLMGLWHGAGKFFVLWGIYHGALIVLYRIVPLDSYLIKFLGTLWGKVTSIAVMFLFTLFGWLLFWVRSDEDFQQIFQSLIRVRYLITDFSLIPTGFYELGYGLLLFTAPIIITEIIGFRYKREFVDMNRFFNTKIKSTLYLIMFYGVLFFGMRGSYDFVYFQF